VPVIRQFATLVRARRNDDERGFVLIFFTLALVLLLAIAGLAVDFTNWQLQGARIQRTADAAALAGAVFMPDDFNTASQKAIQIAATNGYSSGVVPARVPGHPDQLQVTITVSVPTYFTRVLGLSSKTIQKTAIGEFEKPVAMGSPSNQYGNDPESTGNPGSTKYPNFWGNVAGPDSDKVSGDAYTADVCSSSNTDHCSGGSNSDYDPNGYYYTVRVRANTGALTIQAFDPAFVNVGDHCPNSWTPDTGDNHNPHASASNLQGASQLNPSLIKGYPSGGVSSATRYKPVADPNNSTDPGARYCTGDQIFNNGDDGAPDTTYSVLGPATVAGDPNTAPPVSGCSTTFPGYMGDIAARLQSNTNYVGGLKFAQVFRQWVSLCTIASPQQGDYFVRVSTSTGAGHNRFALRAGMGCGTNFNCSDTADVSLFGNAKMAMYANVGVSTTRFYLARVTPGAPGRTLTLSLYDIGDAQVSGSLQIMKSDANGNDTGLTGCQYTPPGSSTYQSSSSCTITGVDSSFNGRWVNVRIPVPDTSTGPPRCDASNPNDCWFTIHYLFNGGLQDTTSWTAQLDGEPVRIIQ